MFPELRSGAPLGGAGLGIQVWGYRFGVHCSGFRRSEGGEWKGVVTGI